MEYSLPMTKDDLFGLLGTYSGVITLDPAKRADFFQRARDFLDRQPWEQIEVPMVCRCLRSTRLHCLHGRKNSKSFVRTDPEFPSNGPSEPRTG